MLPAVLFIATKSHASKKVKKLLTFMSDANSMTSEMFVTAILYAFVALHIHECHQLSSQFSLATGARNCRMVVK